MDAMNPAPSSGITIGNAVGINSAIIDSLGCAETSDAVRDFLLMSRLAEAA